MSEVIIDGESLMKSWTFLFPTDAGGRFSCEKPSPNALCGTEEITMIRNKNVKNVSVNCILKYQTYSKRVFFHI